MANIAENLVFGIDLGIGSCGWAVLNQKAKDENIVALGSWCFDVPETDKERIPTNQIRRANRLLRRVIRRRRNRMAEIRRLFASKGMLDTADPDALAKISADPWEMRAKGLDYQLTPQEFAVALGHIAKRRGFKSAAKRVSTNAPSEDSKMLAALEKTKEQSAQYRTIGEMFARDPAYADRRRNRDGCFDRTMSREDLFKETQILFESQRRLGNFSATSETEQAFIDIAFRQKPMQDSERLVETCLFEPDEKRASRFAPSFERFRLLCRLVNLRVTDGLEDRPLTPEELRLACEDAGKTRKLSVKKVRSLIGLRDDQRFTTIPPDQEQHDIAARTGDALTGTATFRAILGESFWRQLLPHPEQLDRAAWIISFHELTDTIISKLATIGLPSEVMELIRKALEDGKFSKFKGAASLSDKAARKLIPFLQEGLTYDKACQKAGYNHAASKFTHYDSIDTKAKFNSLMDDVRDSITNPVARKAISEGMKQVWAMRNQWGLPGAICIELARDVGNSAEKRREIESGIKKNTAQRERERQEAKEHLNQSDISSETLLRYRLWKEQGGRCCYTDQPITPSQLIASDNSVQVDHILPWSRFGDDSYLNKALCTAKANQEKKNRTPWEWIHNQKGVEAWNHFTAAVESRKETRGLKKRNFLLKSSKETEERFRSRNLNDTRYAARVMAEAVRLLYPSGNRAEKGGVKRVFTRPGALTAALRHAWGVESLKKINGKRLNDDRHHALDAAVVAAVSEKEIQKLTKSFQICEQKGLARPMRDVPMPWEGFRHQLETAYADIRVARPERRRARGKGHDATIRQLREEKDGPVVYERRAISDLKLTDLERIKDPERNSAIISSLRTWIEKGKPADYPPQSPKGDEIRKIRVMSRNKPAVSVRGGTADRGEMTRVDVFTKMGKKGKPEWFLVPIYRHQVIDRIQWPQPPNQAAANGKSEKNWPTMGLEHEFRFSLYPRSYVQIVKRDGEIIEGYFAGLDRTVAAFSLLSSSDPTSIQRGIGAKTLESIRKYNVNRFGDISMVEQETRTWHGDVCISPDQPDSA
ncbi:CRISPR-associated Csn1 family endonuclease [Acetobacter aceti NBRC 14818]|uniref:CRISPR-associated endonuclease Cas9 n=1 Tax=Acetobacter aceti NBRC 14818 TaxID=887700 RepID=A0AB33IBK1_ACEAC|nr:type II CRISPR RNA-guided endonuclease Cas9 [Acetobacter aceti]TCS32840.1 CRISPR-associated Csn1 family endonuclease [Acetobacter aceti NBRC 14818]BCK74747.1 CRISPR-associated endonuclease Cas9 [Acetobacter aceti NBRC 14818]GAN58042.1 CRISPR-associated protein [Acetobacter aceti NBRC 14818]